MPFIIRLRFPFAWTMAFTVACALGSAGCALPVSLGVVELASSDPASAAPQSDVLGAFTAAKQSLIARVERSIVRPRTLEPRTRFAATQIEAASPPAAFEGDLQAELLPITPPHMEPPAVAASQPPADGALPGTQQRIKAIREVSLDIRPPRLFNDQQQAMPAPLDEAATALPLMAQAQPFTRGDLANSGYHWQPTPEGLSFCYQPLYFQEVNVERYGRSFGMFQPVVSVASFYGRVPLLPYMAFARPARRCTCPPHWSLPGYRIPEWERHEFVPSFAGGSAEVAALAGLILLIP